MHSGNKINVGIAGLGTVSAAHIHACARLDRVRLVAAADPSEVSRQRYANHGMTLYADVEQMLRSEKLDALCIFSTVATHEAIAVAGAKAGLHILCEKPLALSVTSAQRMVAACSAAGVKFFYGSTNRYLPTLRRARQLVSDGSLGEVVLFREEVIGGAGADAYQPMSFEHYPKSGPGGGGWGLVDHGIHMIDLFSWLTDRPIEAAFGRGDLSGNEPHSEYAMLTLRDSPATGHLLYAQNTYSTDLPAHGIFMRGRGWGNEGFHTAGVWDPHPACIHIYGTHGALRIHHYANELFQASAEGMKRLTIEGPPPPIQFAHQMAAFAASILHDTPAEIPGEVGVDALRVLEAIYRSGETGRLTPVAPDLSESRGNS
jgi:UDP-N-acetyl-2-amino-2-deoxyglucuronate dehydrogenase